jgi:ribosomal protein S18 acetylase RimI-like enzyme
MELGEAAQVAALLKSVIESTDYYNDRAKREEIAKYSGKDLEDEVAADPNAVLVARLAGEIAGLCISRYDDGLLWLSWFCTSGVHRGRGIGLSLLEALGTTLTIRKAHKIWCDTRSDNARAQRVLARAGFVRLCDLRNHWYGQDFVLWEWTPR